MTDTSIKPVDLDDMLYILANLPELLTDERERRNITLRKAVMELRQMGVTRFTFQHWWNIEERESSPSLANLVALLEWLKQSMQQESS